MCLGARFKRIKELTVELMVKKNLGKWRIRNERSPLSSKSDHEVTDVVFLMELYS